MKIDRMIDKTTDGDDQVQDDEELNAIWWISTQIYLLIDLAGVFF